jgi:hypothetical protein
MASMSRSVYARFLISVLFLADLSFDILTVFTSFAYVYAYST